jgi:hypothetical protein
VGWHAWAPEQLAARLPGLIAEVESRFDELPAAHTAKNRAALAALHARPIPADELPAPGRGELAVLGLALSALGHQRANVGQHAGALEHFQAAHELFRAINVGLRPSRLMHQALGNALRARAAVAAAGAGGGDGDAGSLRADLRAAVMDAWGDLPGPLALQVDETVLNELERARVDLEADLAEHERFVRANLRSVLELELPSRLEAVRARWLSLGERVAPEAVRSAAQAVRRPRALSTLLPPSARDALRRSIETGDAPTLGSALAPERDGLDTNLRLRLEAPADYREPAAELRFQGGPDRFFAEARALLLQPGGGEEALRRFREIHYHRGSHTVAKEWYAYALARHGTPTDVWDVIDLLEETVRSPHFRPDLGWTAHWNLAVALRRVPSRADEALDALLPLLQNDVHPAEAFDLALLWALEQERDDVLVDLLARARHQEAHLLAALLAVDLDQAGAGDMGDHFRRVNRVLADPDRTFPDPKERLALGELDTITRDFLESSLVGAGVEWFRQRLSYDTERGVFKNWECAAVLNEAAGDLPAAWRCRQRQWECTERNPRVDPARKSGLVRFLLAWAQRNGFAAEALALLRQSWRSSGLADNELRLWEQRLAPTPEPGAGPATPSREELAHAFERVSTVEALAARAGDAGSLLDLVEAPPAAAEALERVVRLAARFAADPTVARQMMDELPTLWLHRASLPPTLRSLAAACEKAIQDASIKAAQPRRAAGPPAAPARAGGRPVALMLDWENVKIGLEAAGERPSTGDLARRLVEAAAHHGPVRERWAVADWDRPSFQGDQRAIAAAGFLTAIAGSQKADGSDHVLRERIHAVLRDRPDVGTFILGSGDADFAEVVATLRREGKEVVLWSTRRSTSAAYGGGLAGPDRITIEWLEDIASSVPPAEPGR